MNKIITLILIVSSLLFDVLMASGFSWEVASLKKEPLWNSTIILQPAVECKEALVDDGPLLDGLDATVRSVISWLELDEMPIKEKDEEESPCDGSSESLETFPFPPCDFCPWRHHPFFVCLPKHMFFVWRNYQACLHFEQQRRIMYLELERQRWLEYQKFLERQTVIEDDSCDE
jgi:hypothetical protein